MTTVGAHVNMTHVKTNPLISWIRCWGPAIVIMAVIFLLSATPSRILPNFGVSDTLVKKGAHMLGYALLTLAYMRGMSGLQAGGKQSWKAAALSLILAALYAMSDEYHQSFVPGRNSRWTDVGIDAVGGTVGLILWSLLPSLRRATAFRLPSALKGGG